MDQQNDEIGGDAIQLRPTGAEGEYTLTLDGGEGFCSAIAMAIAEIRGCDPLELPPIYDVLNPDSVNDVVASIVAADEAAVGPMTIRVYDHVVTVDVDGSVTLREADVGSGPALGSAPSSEE